MTTLSLSNNYGYAPERLSGLAEGTIIDARSATFIHDNWAGDGGGNNPYPFQVFGTPGAIILGGTIKGEIDQTADWRTVYDHGNSAAVRIEDTPNATIQDWRISNTWDAVRVSWNSDNFLIKNVWVTNARDDAVENDRLNSGTIKDSLFDGVFSGVSLDPSSASPVDGRNKTVTLDGVLMRMKSYVYEGELTHSAFIKTDSATLGAVTPQLRFINNVFALEDVNHHSYRSMFDAWSHTIESRGNYFLNLSDTPLPAGYPTPPAGWTVLQGQAARDYWQNARASWITTHSGGSALPPDPTPDPAPDPVPPPVTPDVGGISISDVTVAEGDSGTKTATFTVSRTGTSAFQVDFATADGTATAASDYVAKAGTLQFAAGQKTQAVTVQVNGDATIEANETFTLKLVNASNGGTIIDNQGLATIDNDDVATPPPSPVPAPTGIAPTFTAANFTGSAANETIVGNALNNSINGGDGSDTIFGGGGNDYLRGNDGADVLWGGAGTDIYVFKNVSDSRQKTGIDTIMDFTKGEKIDLSAIDANRGVLADQAFNLQTGAFTTPGQLHVDYDAATNHTVISGNVDTDAEAELMIVLNGNITVTASDFIL